MPLATDPNEARRRAIIDAIMNQPKSTMMDKFSAGLEGFKETGGMAGVGGAGGAGATPSVGTPAPTVGTPPPATPALGASVTEPDLGAAPSTPPPVAASYANKFKMPTLTGGLEAAGMSPGTAKQIETLTHILKDRDPNRAYRNMGRIAGIVARFYGG